MSWGRQRSDGEILARHADTGTAARFFFQVEQDIAEAAPVRYVPKAARKERDAGLPEGERCKHPTVKPLALTRYLATLLLPPDAYAPRRILVPFAGSGSEMIGALQAGWEYALGVEMEAEYVEIAQARIKGNVGLLI